MDYFESSEEACDKRFSELNNDIEWFTGCERNELFSDVDWYCKDVKGRKIALEIKIRSCGIKTYPSIFFEPHKYQVMKEKEKEGYIPLYLCFFNDDTAAMWDVRKLSPYDMDSTKTVEKVHDIGREYDRVVERYHLDIKKAIIFQKFMGKWFQVLRTGSLLREKKGGGSPKKSY